MLAGVGPFLVSDGLGTRGKRFLGPVSPPVHLTRGRGTQIGPFYFWVLAPPKKKIAPKSRSNATRAHKTQKMVRFGSPDLWTSALGVKRVRGIDPPWSRDRPKPKKCPKLPKFKHLPPITNGSNMGPITTDFDETRWDLIPPMRPRSSGGSRVKKSNFEIYF